MAKSRSVYICQSCGEDFPKWSGRCPACGDWNSLVESIRLGQEGKRAREREARVAAKQQRLSEIKVEQSVRMPTGFGELDTVLGGGPTSSTTQGRDFGGAGIVPGSMVLVAGEPGIGKSTLLLQLADKVSENPDRQRSEDSKIQRQNQRIKESKNQNKGKNSKNQKLEELQTKSSSQPVLYVSGEESLTQIKLRAERLGVRGDNISFLAEVDVDNVVATLSSMPFVLCIIDSIQTLTTDDLTGVAGSVGQVRECAARLLRVGKELGVPIFLVGHVTKEGNIAGPKVLEHMVDTVLYFEGDRYGATRLLRTTKNRFGATDEVGIFEMRDRGLVEVSNPSELFLRERQEAAAGSVVTATMEGTRPLLVEVQALTVPSQLAMPRRVGQGVDFNRLQLIVAVLTKQLRLPLGSHDVFVNVAGGLKINEPAADLAVALAIVSSFKNVPVGAKTVVFGELGLLGELRQVSQAERRAKEARRLGFTQVVSPEKYTSINLAVKSLI